MKKISILVATMALLLFSGCIPPTFNPVSGVYPDDIEVKMNSPLADTIFYTTDGSDPLPATAYKYRAGDTIVVKGPGTTTIKAIAIFAGITSRVAIAVYTIGGSEQIWYRDRDNDGYGDPATSLESIEQPSGYVANNTDCDDTSADINPGERETCGDGVDQDCSGSDISCDDVDNDGDGYTENQGDCNDADVHTRPGAEEIPYDGIDQDCSGADLTDADSDGYDAAITGGNDCEDNNAAIHPGASDPCGDGIDQNCDGSDLCNGDEDEDNDGYSPLTDCNDNNASIHPGATDIPYDGIDQNCSGTDLTDVDEDGSMREWANRDDMPLVK